MADIRKPQPFIVDGKAYYTLSSYDPVSITVTVPYTTDTDVDYALNAAIAQAGGSAQSLADPSWVRAHFDGIEDVGQLRSAIRSEVDAVNRQVAEESKPTRCAEELATRLNQSVPQHDVEEVRDGLEQAFVIRLSQGGLTLDQFLAQTGGRRSDVDEMFSEQAQQLAEQQAAIDAFATKRKIQATDEEMPRLLGLDDAQWAQVRERAKSSGSYDQLREAATRNKAIDQVVSECHCTYEHETPDEAKARISELERIEREARRTSEAMDLSRAGKGGRANAGGATGDEKGPGLHLV